MAVSLSEGDSFKTEQKESVPDKTPHQIHNHKYRPGEWGARFAALTLDDNTTTPPSLSRDTEQGRAKASARAAEAKYRQAGEAVTELGKRGEAAQLRQAAAAEKAAESQRQHQVAVSVLDRIRQTKERMLREKEEDIRAAEMEVQRKEQEVKSSTSTLRKERVAAEAVEDEIKGNRALREKLGKSLLKGAAEPATAARPHQTDIESCQPAGGRSGGHDPKEGCGTHTDHRQRTREHGERPKVGGICSNDCEIPSYVCRILVGISTRAK